MTRKTDRKKLIETVAHLTHEWRRNSAGRGCTLPGIEASIEGTLSREYSRGWPALSDSVEQYDWTKFCRDCGRMIERLER